MIDFNDPYVQFALYIAIGSFLGTAVALSVVWGLDWLISKLRGKR